MKNLIIKFTFLFIIGSMVKAQDLFSAARNNNVNLIEQLINSGQDVNQKDQRGFTPLILAVYNGNEEAAKKLLEKGANPNAQDLSGNNAMMGASFKGYLTMIDLLLENKADVNEINLNGASSLIFAVTFGRNDIAKKIIAAGANLSIKDSSGKTALDHAKLQENNEMINYLTRK